MIRQFRLPDPPPGLKERILGRATGGRPRTWRLAPYLGIAGALAALLVILGLILSTRPESRERPGQKTPEDRRGEIRYTAYPSADGTAITLDLYERKTDNEKVLPMTLTAFPGQWATLVLSGREYRAPVLLEASSETGREPKVEERTVIESGRVVCFQPERREDGRIGVDLRVYSILERKVAWSIKASSWVTPREEQVQKLPP